MGLTTDWKRLFLRGVKWDAEEASVTLLSQLKTVSRARLTTSQSGLVLVSTSGNGRTNSFSLPQIGQGLSQNDVIALCESMLTLYTEAKVNLGGSPTDDQIFAEMLALLVPVEEIENDFVCLRG